jgi:hypothetical protein
MAWLTGGSIRVEARLAAANPATDEIALDNHGMQTGDAFQLRLEPGATLPAPLAAGTTYYAIELSDIAFQAAATPTGAAIDITDAGENWSVVRFVPWARFIASSSALIDNQMTGSAVPMDPVPEVVRHFTSLLVIERAMVFAGGSSEDVTRHMDRAQAMFDRWLAGRPIVGEDKPPAASKAIRTPRSSGSATDSRGWGGDTLP